MQDSGARNPSHDNLPKTIPSDFTSLTPALERTVPHAVHFGAKRCHGKNISRNSMVVEVSSYHGW